jgi:flagellar hook-length control protein FliK
VHLKPDYLGRVSIRAISDDHGIQVEIRAESEAVRQVMQDNLSDLRQWLADKDLAFSQLSVLADTGWHSQRQPEWAAEQAPVAPEPEPDQAPEMAVESLPHIQSSIIDYFA